MGRELELPELRQPRHGVVGPSTIFLVQSCRRVVLSGKVDFGESEHLLECCYTVGLTQGRSEVVGFGSTPQSGETNGWKIVA